MKIRIPSADLRRRHRVALRHQQLAAGEVGDVRRPDVGVFLIAPGDVARIAAGAEQHDVPLVGDDDAAVADRAAADGDRWQPRAPASVVGVVGDQRNRCPSCVGTTSKSSPNVASVHMSPMMAAMSGGPMSAASRLVP